VDIDCLAGIQIHNNLISGMKKYLNISYIHWLSHYRLNITKKMNVMASVKRGRSLIKVGLSLALVIGLHPTPSRVRLVINFLRRLSIMFKHNGPKGACLTLKVCDVILQQSLGGMRVKDIGLLKVRVARNHAGMPRLIPREIRELIRRGDYKLARFYRTLFSLYAVIHFEGDKRVQSLLKTIITPGLNTIECLTLVKEIISFIPHFVGVLEGISGKPPVLHSATRILREYKEYKPGPILKSSPWTLSLQKFEDLPQDERFEASFQYPLVSSHPGAAWMAAKAFAHQPVLHHALNYFHNLLPQGNILVEVFNSFIREVPLPQDAIRVTPQGGLVTPRRKLPGSVALPRTLIPIGKLSLKEEAAGKVRVFAMVDCWTQ